MAKKKKAPLHRRIRYKRNIEKYVILPTCLLVLEVFEEFVCYKAEIINNPYLRTLILLLMFFCGFSLVNLVFAPLINKAIEHLYYGGRKSAGPLGEIISLGVVYTALFYVYYLIYSTEAGVEQLLPQSLHNGEAFLSGL
ncbi:MAG: hypothetical protein KGZ25_07100 [Planctomycetes bacterium]|nr:hypothetical protein [Planctomycetota bacterium]